MTAMRYNPPPNWPPPPPGWQPSPTWTPDPAWPPPPSGWQLFVDDDAAPAERSGPAIPDTLGELGPDQLSVDHVGARAMAVWEDDGRYEIGTIAGVSADPATITVRLAGSATIAFPRDGAAGGPRLYVAK